MVKQYRFRLRDADAHPDVWLYSGNLFDWLGVDAISRVVCVETREIVSHTEGRPRFEAYLDGALIGEIRDDANGRTYYALA